MKCTIQNSKQMAGQDVGKLMLAKAQGFCFLQALGSGHMATNSLLTVFRIELFDVLFVLAHVVFRATQLEKNKSLLLVLGWRERHYCSVLTQSTV